MFYHVKCFAPVSIFVLRLFFFSTQYFLFCICSPVEPPPPPPEDVAWENVASNVVHLDGEAFKAFCKKKKHVLVMFYAPCEFNSIHVVG